MFNARRLLAASVSVVLALGVVLALREMDLLPRLRGGGDVLQGDGSGLRTLLAERAKEGGEGTLIGSVPAEDAELVFPMLRSTEVVHDDALFFRRAPDLANGRRFPEAPKGMWKLRTNSAGFRENRELPEAPDARVLVIGDSHTDGVCPNAMSFANVLERALGERHPGRTIDVVNAGVGGYSFYNFLRGLDVYAEELDVDVYVCAVYGGNDFLEALAPRHYFERTELPTGGARYAEALREFTDAWGADIDAVVAQGVQQLAFLNHAEGQAALALDTASQLTRAMARRAEELGVELVFVYLPSLWDVQLERFTDVPRAELAGALGLDAPGAERTHDAWAEAWMAVVRDLGLPLLDMRTPWREVDADRYWHQDHHISIDAHADVARLLLPVVEPLLKL